MQPFRSEVLMYEAAVDELLDFVDFERASLGADIDEHHVLLAEGCACAS